MQVFDDTLTKDSLWQGEIVLWQPQRGLGYRFNLDPVLLAGFVAAPSALQPAPRILDLGAGCGIIGILLLAMGKASHVVAVERQAQLAAAARRNVEENHLQHKMQVVHEDVRHLCIADNKNAFDLIVTNPPYYALNSGRESPDAGTEQGRREHHGGIADFLACAAYVLKPAGRLSMIWPLQRLETLQRLLLEYPFAITRQQMICARQGRDAKYALFELSLVAPESAGAADIMKESMSPLVVHAEFGRAFSQEVRRLLRE